MTALIIQIQSPMVRCFLWTLWFPVIVLELGTTCAILGIARLACGVTHVACQLFVLYLTGIAGPSRRK
jgi:hypothetical protein